jgi:hypothetical protein
MIAVATDQVEQLRTQLANHEMQDQLNFKEVRAAIADLRVEMKGITTTIKFLGGVAVIAIPILTKVVDVWLNSLRGPH